MLNIVSSKARGEAPMSAKNGSIKLVAGNSNPALANAIAEWLHLPLTKASVRRFVVGETADAGLGQRQMQPFGDGVRQGRIGVAGDELDGAVLGRHRGFSPRLAGYDVQHMGHPRNRRVSMGEVISRRGLCWQPVH